MPSITPLSAPRSGMITDAPAPQPATGAAPNPRFGEFLVLLDDQAQRKVEKAFTMPMGPKRREYVAQTLIDNMMKTQQPLWDTLDGLKAAGHVESYQPLWIQNAIVVRGDEKAETVMAHAAGVAQAVRSATFALGQPAFEAETFSVPESADKPLEDPTTLPQGAPSKGKAAKGLLWDVARMGAPDAWKQGLTGKGVVVGVVDTGVDVEHPALLKNYRGYNVRYGASNHTGNWFDATGASATPADDGGHGTHVAGKIVGGYGSARIGMAPDASFVAARGLGERGGTDGMLLRSMQYMVAPRVPTPGTAPGSRRDLTLGADIINHSWGSVDGLSVSYMNALRNMAAMGVINVISAGNDGQGGKAGSVGSPASSPYVVSVAATDRKDKVAEFSSRGPNPLPTTDGEPHPIIAAPGVDTFSSIPGGRFEAGWQGTSMAAPAATGIMALAQQAAMEVTGKKFDVMAMKDVLKRISQDVDIKGVDDNTGYGIPTVPANFRDVIKQVAVERGLMKAPAAKASTAAAPKSAPAGK
jgi:subtilisin family serine protease